MRRMGLRIGQMPRSPRSRAASSGRVEEFRPAGESAVTGKGTVQLTFAMWDTTSDIIDSIDIPKKKVRCDRHGDDGRRRRTLEWNGTEDVSRHPYYVPQEHGKTLAVSGSTFNISSLGQ